MPPIAIIGLQGRFPGGARTPDEFFEQLLAAKSFCGPVPSDRWSTARFVTEERAAGKTQTAHGYFLNYDYQGFDPDVFGLPPDEIAVMDPQQRLVLEVAWEALEHAGVDPAGLSGQLVGVYVGGFTTDHLLNQFSVQARSALGRFSAVGSTLTMLSNRVSYALDLRGPSQTIDTACASSLSALDSAVKDLRSGACAMALAGGVNFMLRPEYSIGMSAAGLLATDGRCKPFSALADGYGRGEGCGMLVLKRLADAQANGDRVLAVIESIGTGHDGRTAGISLPNGQAQQALMRQVLDASGLNATDIACVEAHGTGTSQGDTVEAGSIAAVYAQHAQTGHPLPIGSLKANIGHLEAAAGVAGVIKAVLMLQRQRIAPHLLIGRPNPAITFGPLNLQLAPACAMSAGARVAVNGFGYGGSIAHVILGPAPKRSVVGRREKPNHGARREARMLPLSAQSPAALKKWIGLLANRTAQGISRDDLLHTMGTRRGHRAFRASVWLKPEMDSAAMVSCLNDCRNNLQNGPETEPEQVATGSRGRTAFVFAGMGPEWGGMGRRLWADEPEFRVALEDVNAIFQPLSGFSIVDAIMSHGAAARMHDCRIAQPANFALQIGLYRLFAKHGLRPDLCLGHSAGEVAAAWAARHLTLAEAVTVCWVRSELQSRCSGRGRMLSAMVTEAEAQKLCAEIPELELAAVNAPDLVTLTGPGEAVMRAGRALDEAHRASRLVDGNIAYHSAAMDEILESLDSRLSGIAPQTPEVPLISTVTGQMIEMPGMDASYWQRNVRFPVRFQASLQTAFACGVTHFVELAAKPVLQSAIRKTALAGSHEVMTISALDGTAGESSSVRKVLSKLYATGANINWPQATPAGDLVDLPPISWQRERFWHETSTQAQDRLGSGPGKRMAEPGTVPRSWIADLNNQGLAFLQDHRLEGVSVLAGAATLEAALQAATAAARNDNGAFAPVFLSDIHFENPFPLDRKKGQVLDSRITGEMLETLAYDRANPNGEVTVLRARAASGIAAPPAKSITELATSAPYPLDIEQHQSRLSKLGFDHGQAFRTLRRVSLAADGKAALAELSRAPALSEQAAFYAHPGLMDGVFQAALALTTNIEPFVPTAIGRCDLFAPLPTHLWAFLQLRDGPGAEWRFDARLYDDSGTCIARLLDIQVTALRPAPIPEILPEQCLMTQWLPAPLHESDHSVRRVSIVADDDDTDAARLCETFLGLGVTVVAEGPAESTVFLLKPTCDLATSMIRILSLIADGGQGRLYLLTRNGQALPGDGSGVDPSHAAIWGFGRTLHNELPANNATLIDTDSDSQWHDSVAREISANASSSELVVRGAKRFLPRLCPVDLAGKSPTVPRFRSAASYLITGGLGGFGRQLALWLARCGAGRVVLTTRTRPPEAETIPLVRALRASGAEACIEVLDLTDGNAVLELFARIDDSNTPLAGVFHWAGQILDKPAADLTASDIQRVLEPKATGAHNLHVASLNSALDHFVLASSLSAVVGNPRQANYAAANAWLDGLAWTRTHAGLPALSINFGVISGAGMGADRRVGAYLRAAGLPTMTTTVALAGLGRALTCRWPQISMARAIDATRWVRYDPRCAATDKMTDLLGDARDALQASEEIHSSLAACSREQRPRLVAEYLRKRLAEILKLPIRRLSSDQALSRQGLDSFAAVELQVAIDRDFGVAMPIVSLIGGQCLADVGRQIAEALIIEEG